jgi:predicted RNase H-like HicB family nuclease
MERLITLHVEALEEGGYVATSEDVQGLVAQGRTVQETLQIAQDVARRLLEAQSERSQARPLKPVESSFDYPLVIGA